jgi:hypothetical protein
LPVDSAAFIEHVRTLLIETAAQADETYHDNPSFKMIDGRPKLDRQAKKATPPGFKQLDEALTRKLDALELSLLDVLADTMQWIAWGEHFAPLTGHQGKIQEEGRRKILMTFAYGTAWGRRKPPRTSPTSARARFPSSSATSHHGEARSGHLRRDQCL